MNPHSSLNLNLYLSLAAFFVFGVSSIYANREVITLESDWHFNKGDVDIDTSSNEWEKVTVPHTWNALDAQSGPLAVSDQQETALEAEAAAKARKIAVKGTNDSHTSSGYYRGACWYDHKLDIPLEWKGRKRVFIRFGAAATVAKTYINKTLLGEHRGGFTAFCYELTDYLDYGHANELRVQVDNVHREDIAPISADFNVFGGLYRYVNLIVTDEVCISPLDFASSGVYLSTTALTAKQATVKVRTIVSNGVKPKKVFIQSVVTRGLMDEREPEDIGKPPTKQVTVKTEVTDPSGGMVAQESSIKELALDQTTPVSQIMMIKDPHRWNGLKDPYLYTVTVSLICDGKTVDQVSQPLGLRTVSITQKDGFLLNGKPYPILGVNRHQDVRGKGWAVKHEDEDRDSALIRDVGATAIRDTHYPQSEYWHALNDRAGILVWDEVTQVNTTRQTRGYWMNTEEYLREMVHQLYNHPCIAWWGIFNELGNRPMSPCNRELAHLQDVAKEMDPSRIIVSASEANNRSFNKVTDQVGFNRYPGWYGTEPDDALRDYIKDRSKEVGKRIAISEYGAGGNIRHHSKAQPVKPDTKGAFHPEEWQTHVHEIDWSAIRNNPNLWGSFVWNMFDFACKDRDEGNTPSLNDKGLVSHDRRFKKDAFYFYKANWNPEPMVYITSRRAVERTEPLTDVKVYSNRPEVELRVNGKSIGKQRSDELHIARWQAVRLIPGNNTIEALSADGTASDSCIWTLQEAARN